MSAQKSVNANDYKTLSFTRHEDLARGNILTVTIDRAETYNSVDADLHNDLARIFYDLQNDPADVIVLTGAGKSFCAGGNMDWFQTMIDDPSRFQALVPEAKSIVFSLLELEKPIICRLNGAAAGLGASIALLCDIVVASEKAKIGDPHVAMGLVAGDGGAVIWPQLIGFNRAKEYLMTGEMIPADEAYRIGLLNHVVPANELDAKTYAIAEKLANGATQAIRWTKTVTNLPLRQLAAQVMDAAISYESITNMSADHQEAVDAFNAGKSPRFTGK